MAFEQYVDVFLGDNLLSDACLADCKMEYLTLKSYIKDNKIIVAQKGTKAFGKLNILPLFCEIFSEKFTYYLEEFPIIAKDLYDLGVTGNLTEMLTEKFMCYDFSELIYKIYKHHSVKLDEQVWSTQNLEDKKQWREALEFLYLIYEITYFFSKGQILDTGEDYDESHRVSTRRPPIDWCAFCFRRVKSIGEQRPLQARSSIHDQRFPENKSRKTVQLLCNKHKSTRGNDSIYRGFRKRAKSLTEEDRQYIDQIHAERRLFEIANFNKPIDNKVTAEQWEISKSKWLGYLSELCPYADLSGITDWDEFTTRFHLLLDNDLEDTQVPLFIEDIYMEAKIWIELERNHYMKDKRRKSL